MFGSRLGLHSHTCLSQFVVETIGAINKDGMDFLSGLGRRITQSTDNYLKSAFLFQRLSVLIQCYSAVAILCTFTRITSGDDI